MRFDTIRDGETTSGRQRMRHRSGHRRRRSEDDGRAGSSTARPSRTTPGPTAGSSGRGARSGRVRPGADPGDRQRLDVKRYHHASHDPLRTHLADVRGRLRLRPQTPDPRRPHAPQIRLQDLDIRAGSIHPRSGPQDAGAEYLGHPEDFDRRRGQNDHEEDGQEEHDHRHRQLRRERRSLLFGIGHPAIPLFLRKDTDRSS